MFLSSQRSHQCTPQSRWLKTSQVFFVTFTVCRLFIQHHSLHTSWRGCTSFEVRLKKNLLGALGLGTLPFAISEGNHPSWPRVVLVITNRRFCDSSIHPDNQQFSVCLFTASVSKHPGRFHGKLPTPTKRRTSQTCCPKLQRFRLGELWFIVREENLAAKPPLGFSCPDARR